MDDPQRPWRTRKMVEAELSLAKLGRSRVLACNKVIYDSRIKRLERELEAMG